MENLTPEQLRSLILYHSANSRFHNVQCSLIKNEFFPEKGFNSETSNEFVKLHMMISSIWCLCDGHLECIRVEKMVTEKKEKMNR